MVAPQTRSGPITTDWKAFEHCAGGGDATRPPYVDLDPPRTAHLHAPLPVRTLQVDGGSEFAPAFEQACQKRAPAVRAPAPLVEPERVELLGMGALGAFDRPVLEKHRQAYYVRK